MRNWINRIVNQGPKIRTAVAVLLVAVILTHGMGTVFAAVGTDGRAGNSGPAAGIEVPKGRTLPPPPKDGDGAVNAAGIREWVARAATYLLAWTIGAMTASSLYWRQIVDNSSRAAANAVVSASSAIGAALERLAEGASVPTGQSVMDAVYRTLIQHGFDRALSTSAANAVKELWNAFTFRF